MASVVFHTCVFFSTAGFPKSVTTRHGFVGESEMNGLGPIKRRNLSLYCFVPTL